MIVLDTETTGHLKPDVADLAAQPHIIEIAVIKLDDKTYKNVDQYHTLVNPEVPLDEETHKRITGLTEKELVNAPTFLEIIDTLTDYFLGERILIAHNCEFDKGVLATELRRIGREFAFPWPPTQICTVERTKHIRGQRLKLLELYEHVFKRKLDQSHRALGDAAALADIVRKLKVKP